MSNTMIRLGHVNIRTPKLEETVAFYANVLGLSATGAATRPGSKDHVWLVDGSGAPSVHIQRSEAPAPSGGDSGVHHLAFDCENPALWRERLSSLDVPFSESEFPVAGMLQLNLADPNGIRLVLTFRQ
jgi:catechol 2,3-dioxygenase-like lactoylglutathione lyase family enzyme